MSSREDSSVEILIDTETDEYAVTIRVPFENVALDDMTDEFVAATEFASYRFPYEETVIKHNAKEHNHPKWDNTEAEHQAYYDARDNVRAELGYKSDESYAAVEKLKKEMLNVVHLPNVCPACKATEQLRKFTDNEPKVIAPWRKPASEWTTEPVLSMVKVQKNIQTDELEIALFDSEGNNRKEFKVPMEVLNEGKSAGSAWTAK